MKRLLLAFFLLISLNLNAQIISTVAGTGVAGYSGDGGPATAGMINHPAQIAMDGAGNVYFAETNNNIIRKISTTGIISTVAGTGAVGYSGDGGPATAATLNAPYGVDVDAAGNLYISDFSNSVMRKVSTAGIITTIAGNGTLGYSGDGGPATAAAMHFPGFFRLDHLGNIFISDNGNHAVRKVSTTGIITTIAGTGVIGYSGDGGPATNATLNYPNGIWVDLAGNVYIGDADNNVIRLVNTAGIIHTFAGTGVASFSGDGGPATAATMNIPQAIYGDNAGNLYIPDTRNSRIRVVNAAGIISTICGTAVSGYNGDGILASTAQLYYPNSVYINAAGNIYISDCFNQRIREIRATSSGCLTSSLIINTGYDPVANAAITAGTNGGTPVPDPHWILSAVSPGVATAIAATPIPGLIEVVPGNAADIVQTLTGSWVTNPVADPGGWISCLNSNTYNDCLCGTPYNMTLGRPFRMCGDDSIKLSFYIANDNYISASDLDGVPLGFTQTTPPATTNFSMYTYFTKTVYLTSGTHTVHFEVNNWNITTGSPANPTGLDIYGTVSSVTGSNTLISESSAACNAYVCGGTCPILTMPDTVKLCLHDTATLTPTISGSDSILSMTWSPATGLSSTTILNPVVTATTSGWYDFTVQSLLPDNLVANGDFQFGNVGFTSTYIWSPPPSTILNEGYYSIYNNPNGVHTGFLSMGSYPITGGNMLIINGGSTASSVWCETIAVTPNTNYDFSAWFADCSAVTTGIYVPVLQFMVNGVLLGTPTPVSAAPGTWMNFFQTWNSGTNTSASICIYDETTAAEGNDFVIDDISFEPICKVTDSVYVKVNPVDTAYSHTDTSICSLTPTVTLYAPTGFTNYKWNTGVIGVSSITGAVGGTYWVEDTGICILRVDTFHLNPITPDTTYSSSAPTLCQGSSATLTAPTGYTLPHWSTGSTAASITITNAGTYWVDEAGTCGGVSDTFNVTYRPPVIAAAKDTVKGCFYLVDFMGNPTGNEYTYLWTGPDGFSSTMQNPVIQSGGPANEGVYTLTVTDNTTGCEGKANTTLVIVPIPPVQLSNVSGTQTINYGSSVQLNADNALYYWWLPDDGTISNRNINNPFVNPTQTTVYTVYGMDSLGCVDSSKITVNVIDDSISIPTAFTPNNDGLNDVFRPLGMKYQGLVEFSVYNRWGQRIFSTSNKDQGWDGTFNGVKQDVDVYNYVIIVSLTDGTTRMFKGNVTLVR